MLIGGFIGSPLGFIASPVFTSAEIAALDDIDDSELAERLPGIVAVIRDVQ